MKTLTINDYPNDVVFLGFTKDELQNIVLSLEICDIENCTEGNFIHINFTVRSVTQIRDFLTAELQRIGAE